MLNRLRGFAFRPAGWSTLRVVLVFGVMPVAMVVYAVFAPREATVYDALAVAAMASTLATSCLWLYFRFLNPALGSKTAGAALSLVVGAVFFVAAWAAPTCLSGSQKRCTPLEAAEAGFAGLLLPVAVALLFGLPVALIAAGRRIVAFRERWSEAQAHQAANQDRPRHRGRVTDPAPKGDTTR